ncbi:VWA containing CoxE family protein [Massilia sp. WF1]|uniref:VWA domain-containing protein n=1 Tax=unclassified Massilia TaxID=2609279 RepID=UPI000649BB13|nr:MULTISPECIES: VWA domain-containing protein [unclassified Massilia]ALK97495.1 VWA containing CoxE family protein [Massilia sp. WG5]KLU36677.1 VWA containing CoxE family protein [Massilia sp. WF1]
MSGKDAARRWRLVLGRYAGEQLDDALQDQRDRELDLSLDYLYGREYEGRGLRLGPGRQRGQGGSLDPSQVRALDWLERTRKLFPREVYERIQGHALDRYQLSELLNDPATLLSLEPNQALARTLLQMRGRLSGAMLDAVRSVIRKVVEDITRTLRSEFVNALQGRRDRFRQSQLRSSQNFDWRATIRANLRHYDPSSGRLLIERPRFNARIKRHLPWDVILCVDQSGSMLDSVMYSAIVAGILSSLPAVRVRLVLFDTNVVDLSHMAHDPVQVLLTVQLGGGTDIGRALRYCEQLVQSPQRTVLALVSDFEDGAPPGAMLASVRRLAESRVKLLGLAALDQAALPVYDRAMAQRLADRGMQVAALTPTRFAEWLAEVMG